MKIGSRFSLAEENVFGVVDEMFYGDDGELCACVIEMDDGTWASVDMSKVAPRTVH